MYSICMMHTLMLEELQAVATAALTRKHTKTLRCVTIFSLESCYNCWFDLVQSMCSHYKHV
jgi:hypothetical protein